jgi:hypothetical protein
MLDAEIKCIKILQNVSKYLVFYTAGRPGKFWSSLVDVLIKYFLSDTCIRRYIQCTLLHKNTAHVLIRLRDIKRDYALPYTTRVKLLSHYELQKKVLPK